MNYLSEKVASYYHNTDQFIEQYKNSRLSEEDVEKLKDFISMQELFLDFDEIFLLNQLKKGDVLRIGFENQIGIHHYQVEQIYQNNEVLIVIKWDFTSHIVKLTHDNDRIVVGKNRRPIRVFRLKSSDS